MEEEEANMSETITPDMEQVILLNGTDWRIAEEESKGGVSLAPLVAAGEWIEAHVPGNIQADLERNRLLTPLRYGMGDPNLLAVSRKDWRYRKDFRVPD